MAAIPSWPSSSAKTPKANILSKLAHELMDIQYEADELLEPERVAWVTESMRGIEQRERAGD